MVIEFNDENYQEYVDKGKPMVIDFWAEWCGPCRMVSPIIEELAAEYGDKVNIGKMNVDENNEIVSQYGIRNIPTVIFLKDGKLVDKQVGATQKATFAEKINAML